jgi:folylpolyglutamate synthase/dihydropteroate synthase
MNVPSANSPLADWLDYQERLHPRNIELGLDRVGKVAQRLGLPDPSVPTRSRPSSMFRGWRRSW